MLQEWVKYRRGLTNDPKVVVMTRMLFGRDASALANVTRAHNAARKIVVGSLLEVWSDISRSIDSEDFHPFLSLEDLDDMAELPGFGEAMAHVGWVVPVGHGLHFPNFQEFNTPSKVRSSSAKRSKEYRDRQKGKGSERDDERSRALERAQTSAHENASVTHREELEEEEELKEESKSINPPPPSGLRPHSPANASGHIEGKAAAELIELGVEHPVPAVQTAVRNGATLDDIRSLCQVFRSKPGAWKPNALQKRVSRFVPGQSPELGWPEVDPKWLRDQERDKRNQQAQQQARQNEQRRQDDQRAVEDRERRYGPLLDDLSEQELRGLIRELIPDIAQQSHLNKLRRDGPDGYRKPGSYRRDLLRLWERSEEGNAEAAA